MTQSPIADSQDAAVTEIELNCSSVFSWAWLAIAVLTAVFVLVLTHIPQPVIPKALQIGGLDKLAHMMSYAAIAASFLLALPRQRGWRLQAILLAGLVALAAVDELTQPFFDRVASMADFVADLVGMTATYLVLRTQRRQAASTTQRGGRMWRTMNHRQRPRTVIPAAITASFLVLVFGLTYRALSARLVGPLTTVPIARESLERLPRRIADWMGEDLPMDEAVVRATDTDAHVNRRYSQRDSLKSVSLFAGCSVRAFDRVIHRPEYCYPRSGWTLVDRRLTELTLDDGTRLPCTIFQFSRGSLQSEEATVLHYLIADGQPFGNISVLRSRLWHIFSTVDYVARVMIVASDKNLTKEAATDLVCTFAIDSASSIAQLFEEIENERSSGQIRERFQGH